MKLLVIPIRKQMNIFDIIKYINIKKKNVLNHQISLSFTRYNFTS